MDNCLGYIRPSNLRAQILIQSIVVADIPVVNCSAMTWHESCNDFDSRISASAKDASFNDTVFLLTQADADNPAGDEVTTNKAILALISPVFFAQFYGPLASKNDGPIEIVDGTARGFKQLINFIYNPKSFDHKVQNVVEVFDISYFAHKYQIGSLVSLCRQLLTAYYRSGKEVDVLIWAVSSKYGLEWKKTFPAEHALLVHDCWENVSLHFETIFLNGALREDQDLPDECLMVEILRRRPGSLEEGFVLSVALDYYYKVIDKEQKVCNQQKKLKVDLESKWNGKLDKIKSVVQLEKVRPKNLAQIYEKFFNKIPDQVIGKITKEISNNWKDKDTFNSSQNNDDDDYPFETTFSLVGSDNTDDWIHDDTLNSEIQIKLKTNQNAVMRLDLSKIVTCSCTDIDCCVDDSITVQNEDYKEEVTFKRINFEVEEDFYFYVKENKETTLTFVKKCERVTCELHLLRMKEFRLSKEDFKVNILEVNGEPVTSPCYTFIHKLLFTPI